MFTVRLRIQKKNGNLAGGVRGSEISMVVSEVSDAGKDHRHLTIVGRLNDLIVADRAPRLNDCGCPCLRGSNQSIRKWEKRVTCDCTALQGKARFTCFPDRNP